MPSTVGYQDKKYKGIVSHKGTYSLDEEVAHEGTPNPDTEQESEHTGFQWLGWQQRKTPDMLSLRSSWSIHKDTSLTVK